MAPKDPPQDTTAPTSLPSAPSAPARTQSAGKVLYKGTSNVREISVADLAQVGIDTKDREGSKDLRWHAGNLFMLPLSDLSFLSEEEFNRVIKADRDFSIIDGDRDSLPRNHPENNRFKQPPPITTGLPGVSEASGEGPTTTVGGSTA